MSKSSDIASLFGTFGGHAERYQELDAANRAQQSRARWPLLAAVPGVGALDAAPAPTATPQAGPSVSDDGLTVFVAPRPRARVHVSRPALRHGPDAEQAASPSCSVAAPSTVPPAPLPTPARADADMAGAPAAATVLAPAAAQPLAAVFARLGGQDAAAVPNEPPVFARLMGASQP